MILSLLDSMRQRMSWSNARVLLVRAGIEPGLGWQRTVDKIQKLPASPDSGPLEDFLVEHILCGEKFTKLYPVAEERRLELQNAILQQELSKTVPEGAYPLQLADEQLANHPAGMVPIAVEKDEDGIGLVFSTAFQMKKREDISFEVFDDPEDIRARYDEIVGVTFRWVQILSVVWVPHNRNYVELRVDYPRGMHQDAIHALHSNLRKLVNSWGVVTLGEPINLFPAVRAFYDDKKAGRVTEIMFSTTTGGLKNEKIIKRRGQLDQRDEAYHIAGKAGLGTDINLYRVAVEWTFAEDNLFFSPSILLAATGPSGKGPGGEPTITGAFIGGCVRSADYEFVVAQLGEKVGIEV